MTGLKYQECYPFPLRSGDTLTETGGESWDCIIPCTVIGFIQPECLPVIETPEGPQKADGELVPVVNRLSRDQRAFLRFHFANPEVEHKLAEMAFNLKEKGVQYWSLWPIYGTLRYTHMLREQTDTYKLANGHVAYFARLIMRDYFELAGFFEVRGNVVLPPDTPAGDTILLEGLEYDPAKTYGI